MRLDDSLCVGWRVHKKDPPQLCATLIAKAVFQLKPDEVECWPDQEFTVTGDVHPDDDPAKCLRYESDFAPFKPRADLLLVGTAHAPAGKPVPSFPVRWRVGAFSKTLRVTGKRTWQRNLFGKVTISEPEPLALLPLSYEHAFGGPDYPRNPLGQGQQAENAPQIEDASRPPAGPHDDQTIPAGFGPLASAWEPRSTLTGTYDDNYRKERWPWMPKDFDWGYFNAAPRDQQLEGYLRGDEELEMENLHPEHALLRSRLPGRRARWFIRERLPDGGKRFREVPLQLDTLWIDMDALQLVLIWRGLADVQSMRLKEIMEMLVVSEPLAGPQGSLEHYQAELDRRLTEDEAADPAIEAGTAESDRQMAEAEKQANEIKAEIEAERAANPTPPQPSEPSGAAWDEIITYLTATIAELEQQDVPADDVRLVETRNKLAQIEQLRKENPDPLDRAGVEAATRRKESLAGRNLSGLDLSGLNLVGVDLTDAILEKTKLTGANLTKAKLNEAVLANADLTNADLRGASLNGALLLDAQVAGIKIAGASLADASLSKLNLEGVDFTGCVANGVDFSGARLARAQFSGARLAGADFSGCHLLRANFKDAQLQRADFAKVQARLVNMEGADLTGFQASAQADFTGGNFRQIKAADSVWEQCILDESDFTGAQLTRGQFSEASLRKTRCERADLSGADFADACLAEAILTHANLLRASFDRADLRKARCQGANMYEAGFWEAVTDDADFRDANLKSTLLG